MILRTMMKAIALGTVAILQCCTLNNNCAEEANVQMVVIGELGSGDFSNIYLDLVSIKEFNPEIKKDSFEFQSFTPPPANGYNFQGEVALKNPEVTSGMLNGSCPDASQRIALTENSYVVINAFKLDGVKSSLSVAEVSSEGLEIRHGAEVDTLVIKDPLELN